MKADNARIDLVLQELGVPTAEVGLWYAQVGDHVYQGDKLLEVVVNGATFDVTAPANGVLIDKIVHPRDQVRFGMILGAMEADPE